MIRDSYVARTTPAVFYRYFDTASRLLYCGVTQGWVVRHEQHRKKSPWHCLVDPARTTVSHHPTRLDALLVEEAAIETELPIFNIQGVRDFDATLARMNAYLDQVGRPDIIRGMRRLGLAPNRLPYTRLQVSRMAMVPLATVDEWDRSGFIVKEWKGRYARSSVDALLAAYPAVPACTGSAVVAEAG